MVFKIRDSVPSARYSPVCNVLRPNDHIDHGEGKLQQTYGKKATGGVENRAGVRDGSGASH